MTRAEMAALFTDVAQQFGANYFRIGSGDDQRTVYADTLEAVATELSKTCSTCRFFTTGPAHYGTCKARWHRPLDVPADGSGYCYLWKAQGEGHRDATRSSLQQQ